MYLKPLSNKVILAFSGTLGMNPGTLRNGDPFRQWELPEAMSEVRKLLEERSDGDRQFVGILTVVGRYGLEPVASACTQALSDKTVSSDIILAILSKRHDEPKPKPKPEPVSISSQLPLLNLIPLADCSRYDRLMKGVIYGTA